MGKMDGQPGPFHLSPRDRVLEKHCYYTFVCLVVDDGLLDDYRQLTGHKS